MEVTIATVQSAKMAEDIITEFAMIGNMRIVDTRNGLPVIQGTIGIRIITYFVRQNGSREFEIIRKEGGD